MINDRNQQHWVGLASRLSKRELEREIAAHSPRAATPERVRYLNQSTLELQMPISEQGYAQIERALKREKQTKKSASHETNGQKSHRQNDEAKSG